MPQPQPILRYTTFDSSDQFATWQMDNPHIAITSISPLFTGIDTIEKSSKHLAHTAISPSIFVVYYFVGYESERSNDTIED